MPCRSVYTVQGKPSCQGFATSRYVREAFPEEVTFNLGLGGRDSWARMNFSCQANSSDVCTKVSKTSPGVYVKKT